MRRLDQLSRYLRRERIELADVPEMLDLLGRVVGVRAALMSDDWGFEREGIWLQNIPKTWTDAYPEVAGEDPAHAALARTPPCTWFVAARHNPSSFPETRFAELVSHWCHDAMVAMFPGPAGAKSVLGLYRHPDEPLFDDDTLALMQLITPALRRALSGRRALALTDEALATDGVGTIIVSFPDQRVRWSRAAAALVVNLRTLGQSRLDVVVVETAKHWLGGTPGPRRWIGDLTVEVAPIPPGRKEVARCCVTLGRATEVVLGPAASLLSPRQREVVRRRLDGAPLDEVAAAMGITTQTAREYLKESYRRLGVRSLTELGALLAT